MCVGADLGGRSLGKPIPFCRLSLIPILSKASNRHLTMVTMVISVYCMQAPNSHTHIYTIIMDYHLPQVMRECQDNGVWSDLDFTSCTLAESTGSFLLIWVTVEADSPELVREATPELETEVIIGNEILISIIRRPMPIDYRLKSVARLGSN